VGLSINKKENKMNKFLALLTSSILLILSIGSVNATPIEGTISFEGNASVDGSYPLINSIAFSGVEVSGLDELVTGSFDGLEDTAATFYDYSTTNNTLPYTLWTAGSFTFTVTDFAIDLLVDVNNMLIGAISGTGYIESSDPSLDLTAGAWSITGQYINGAVSFSSTAVPAPAGAALLGLCLLGFGFARRNKKAK